MKRKAVKAILCATLMALTLSMTACGGSDDASKGTDAATEEEAEAPEEEKEEPKAEEPEAEEPEAEEPEAEEPEAEEPEEEETNASGQTLEEYLNSTPGAMEAVEAQIAGASGDSLSVTSEIKENDFIFNFTLDASLVTDDAAAQLEAGLDATESVFEQMAAQMDEVIEQEGAVQIVIKYLDPDGNVLAERGFKAQ